MDIAITMLILLLFIVIVCSIALLNIRKDRRAAKSRCKTSCTINRITVNCDADGNVTVVTDDPSKVRVERRS